MSLISSMEYFSFFLFFLSFTFLFYLAPWIFLSFLLAVYLSLPLTENFYTCPYHSSFVLISSHSFSLYLLPPVSCCFSLLSSLLLFSSFYSCFPPSIHLVPEWSLLYVPVRSSPPHHRLLTLADFSYLKDSCVKYLFEGALRFDV